MNLLLKIGDALAATVALILFGFAVLAVWAILAEMACAQTTTTYYGPYGYAGMATTIGPTTQFYGAGGQWLGSSSSIGPFVQMPVPVMPTPPVMPMAPALPMLPIWGR